MVKPFFVLETQDIVFSITANGLTGEASIPHTHTPCVHTPSNLHSPYNAHLTYELSAHLCLQSPLQHWENEAVKYQKKNINGLFKWLH